MPMAVLSNFLIYCVINAFTPGPGNILALNTVTNYGYKKGKPLFFGIFADYYVVQILCAIFVYGVNSLLPNVMEVMKYMVSVIMDCQREKMHHSFCVKSLYPVILMRLLLSMQHRKAILWMSRTQKNLISSFHNYASWYRYCAC